MSKKIFIVDDDNEDIQVMERCLNRAGYDDIYMAYSGEEALDVITEINPDIVIIDTILTGMDGFETCCKIKAMEGINSKVIVLTGIVDAVNADKARKAGADGYCVKVANCSSLLESIDEILK